jgi:hypothetical protein
MFDSRWVCMGCSLPPAISAGSAGYSERFRCSDKLVPLVVRRPSRFEAVHPPRRFRPTEQPEERLGLRPRERDRVPATIGGSRLPVLHDPEDAGTTAWEGSRLRMVITSSARGRKKSASRF